MKHEQNPLQNRERTKEQQKKGFIASSDINCRDLIKSFTREVIKYKNYLYQTQISTAK
jgi:hypothetical protein